MGIGGISIWQLLIILAIVIMIFGTKKLKSLGTDLGSAVKGFRASVTDKSEDKDGEDNAQAATEDTVQQSESNEPKRKSRLKRKRRSKCWILVRPSSMSQLLASLSLVLSGSQTSPDPRPMGQASCVAKYRLSKRHQSRARARRSQAAT